FEERLQKLDVLYLTVGKLVPVGLRQLGEEVPIRALPLPQGRLRLHVDGFVFGLTLALYRTDLDAELAPGAVFWRNLECVAKTLEFPPARLFGLEPFRRIPQQQGVIDLGTDDCMGTNQHALAALNAELLVPHWNLLSDIPLLP